MSLSGDEKERQSDREAKGPQSFGRDLLSAISWEVFGPFILIAMIAIGVFVYSLFPQIGYLGAGGISLAIVLVVFIAIGKKRKPDDS